MLCLFLSCRGYWVVLSIQLCISALAGALGEGSSQPFATNANAVQQEIEIIRRAQRQETQRASHPGPESLRPKMRDNRLATLHD